MTISESDFEQLSQLLDGELGAREREHLQARLLQETELADSWRRLQAMNTRVKSAYAGQDTVGVPAKVRALLTEHKRSHSGSATVVPLFGQRRPVWQMALAASLLVAVAVGLLPDEESESGRQGMDLAAALEITPSGGEWQSLADGTKMQAVLTFPDNSGNWCREFLLQGPDGTERGVACRSAGDWHTEVLAQGSVSGSSDAYRPAGASDSNRVAQYIQEHAADIPLDGDRERVLIQRDWK